MYYVLVYIKTDTRGIPSCVYTQFDTTRKIILNPPTLIFSKCLSSLLPHLHLIAKGILWGFRPSWMPRIMFMSGTFWQLNETVGRGWSTFRYFSHQRSSQYMARPWSRILVAPELKEQGRCLGWTWQRRGGEGGTYFSWNLSRLSAQRDLPSCIIPRWRSCKSRLLYLVPSSVFFPPCVTTGSWYKRSSQVFCAYAQRGRVE